MSFAKCRSASLGLLFLVFGFGFTAMSNSLEAAESGSGFYLLGSKGSLAGIIAPPGLYYSNDSYYFSGKAASSISLPTIGGELASELKARAFVNINTLLYSTEYTILGGRLAYGVSVPVVNQNVSASLTFNLGGESIGGSEKDSTFGFGDPLLAAILGWSHGNLHTTVNFLLNIPIGSHNSGALANAGFNRWGFDATAAFTYLNPENGFEATIAPGLTFNGENLDTGYKSGTEFHVEFAAMKHLSPQLAVGLLGYHYEQITDDSGTAPFGFKGRVTALGPAINFNFNIGELPVSGKVKYLHEFGAKNRIAGDAWFLQIAIPLK